MGAAGIPAVRAVAGPLLASRMGSKGGWCGWVPSGQACGWEMSGGPHRIRADRLR
jgi:hypothetical protein